MRLFLFILLSCISGLLMVGCNENKNAAYFEQHHDQILPSAIECTKLSENTVLKNSTCLSIAEVEKPDCEQELKIKGMIFLPNGRLASCDDTLYLIARPILEAKMKAYLEHQPDPVVEYLKKHPH